MSSSFSGSKAKNRARQIGRRREPLSQRFMRKRREDPLTQQSGKVIIAADASALTDAELRCQDLWLKCRKYSCVQCRVFLQEESDTIWGDEVQCELDLFVRRLISQAPPLLRLGGDRARVDDRAPLPGQEAPKAALEPRMFEHLALLKDLDANAEALQERISAAAVCPEDAKILLALGDNSGPSNLAKHLCLLAPFWLRRPAAWDGCGGEQGLLKHLFARFDAPAFLYSAGSSRSGAPADQVACALRADGSGRQRETCGFTYGLAAVRRVDPTPQRGAAHAETGVRFYVCGGAAAWRDRPRPPPPEQQSRIHPRPHRVLEGGGRHELLV